ncbi:MAG TPA: glycosyltransferase family 39 protein [Ktedonobacteraceae bacterium]
MIGISSPQELTGARKITRKRVLTHAATSRWALPLILAFQTLVSWLLLQNTAFQDEALYVYAGRQIWQAWLGGPPVTDPYSYYISGYPYVFPLIGGGLDLLGGIELARAFSLLCMLIATACGYYIAKTLFHQKAAVFAALFFVCQGPVLFLSRLATYDPMCLCLLAISTALAVHASQARRPWYALSVAPFLVLAFGAKYAALLFIPEVIGILILCTFLKWGWKSALLRGTLVLLAFALVGGVTAAIVLHFDPNMVHAVNATTVNRSVNGISSRLGLAEHVISMVGLSFIIGLLGTVILARNKQFLIAAAFFATSLLIPVYHIYKAEQISLDKHLGFSMFFLMPIAGYALSSLSGFGWRKLVLSGRYWMAGVSLCLILFLIGTGEAQTMYSSWASTSQLAYTMQTQVRPASGRYLAEQFEVSRYNLATDTFDWQWSGLDFFQYTDAQGRYYVGNDAYAKAIDDGYFDMIQLNYGYDLQTALFISKAIEHSKRYTLIARIPYHSSYGPGFFWVWHKI